MLGLVLAGGQSRRMGHNKADLLLPDGSTMLENARGKLRAFCDTLFVLGDGEHCELPDFVPDAGPLGGVIAALRRADEIGEEKLLFLPVDMPLFPKDGLQELIDAKDQAAIVWAKLKGREAPLAAVLDLKIREYLEKLFEGGCRSVFKAWEALGGSGVELSPRFDEEILRNVNCQEDFEEVLAIWDKISQEA